MKKITPEQIVNQIAHGLATDIQTAGYIVEQEKRASGYKETLEAIQEVLVVLNAPPFKGMFMSLIQSAVDEAMKWEEATKAVKVVKQEEAG
jgi:hypothetical protein